jgi:hypothetical protein
VANPARPTASPLVLDVRRTVCDLIGLVVVGFGGGCLHGLLNHTPLPCRPIRTDNDFELADPLLAA